MSIQEFSKISGVESSRLRFWDEIGLFTPQQRNPENNYRYYSVVQLIALNFVTVLSELQIPLKTIADLRKERDPEKLLDLLEKQEKQMDMEMRDLRQRYSIVHARRELINVGMKADENAVSVRRMDETPMILWPRNTYGEGDSFIEPLAAHIAFAEERHINLSFPVGGYHDDMASFALAPERPDHFLSIDPLGVHLRKEGDYLTGYARGYFGEMGDLPERMSAYAREHGIKTAGPVYTVYLFDEISSQDYAQYLAQCCVLINN